MFLSGFFEVGGYMKMEVSLIKRVLKSKKVIYITSITPIIGYSDSNKKKLIYLRSLFGGGVHKEKNKNSWRWYLKSRKLSPLIDNLRVYAPSWETFIKEFDNWSITEDIETKLEIAERVKEISRPQPRDHVSIEYYKRLIENPKFLAGVYESRGVLYKNIRPDSPLDIPLLAIHSQSLNLLYAIKNKYGGGISNILKKKSNSLTYTLGKHQSQKFLKEIEPYLFNY